MSFATAASASSTVAVERQLKAWGLDVNAASVALYTTLKANHSRVSSAMMKKQGMSAQTVLSQGTTVNTSYWLVPITGGQPLAPALTKYKVPNELVVNVSEKHIDLASWHILDKSCPREKLGLGVAEVVLHMKNDTRFLAGDSEATCASPVVVAINAQAATGAQAAAVEVIDTSASGSTNCAAVVAAPGDVSEQQQPPRTTLRQLTRLASDDTDSAKNACAKSRSIWSTTSKRLRPKGATAAPTPMTPRQSNSGREASWRPWSTQDSWMPQPQQQQGVQVQELQPL